jgi:hypothetical protein
LEILTQDQSLSHGSDGQNCGIQITFPAFLCCVLYKSDEQTKKKIRKFKDYGFRFEKKAKNKKINKRMKERKKTKGFVG